MNGALSDLNTIGRIACIEQELTLLRADAYRRAGIPLPAVNHRISHLVELASVTFNVSKVAMLGTTRARKFVRARWAVMWVATEAFGISSTEIGRCLGDRDHSTILYGIGEVEALREMDPEYREITDRFLSIVKPKDHKEEAENAPSSH